MNLRGVMTPGDLAALKALNRARAAEAIAKLGERYVFAEPQPRPRRKPPVLQCPVRLTSPNA